MLDATGISNASFNIFENDILASYAGNGTADRQPQDAAIVDEIREYEALEIEASSVDILKWWAIHAAKLPNLSMLARFIFAIPASSSAPEQNFSTAGYVVSERRTRLSPSTVEGILICHSNSDIDMMNGVCVCISYFFIRTIL